MENRYFSIFIILFCLGITSYAIRDIDVNCPVSTGTIASNHLRVSIDGDIKITNQDSYCYDFPLSRRFTSRPNVAVAINKFSAQQTKSLYLNIKPIPSTKSKDGSYSNPDASLTTISFSVILYQPYTKWTLIEFYFLAQNKIQMEAGYFLVDGSQLSKCDSGKTIDVYMPFLRPLSGSLEAYTFLNGFQISSKPSSGNYNDKYSPLQVQIINKQVTISGVSVTLSVTSNTQIYSVSISYFAFQSKQNKIYGKQYIYQNYQQFPSQSDRTVVHSPQVFIEQMWARIYGISGFIINSNTFDIKFDEGDFANCSIFNFKINNYWKYFSYQYVFFLGGVCSDCQGFNIYYLGDCIKQCPPTMIFNGYTCIKCAQSQVWNGTHCISRCNNGKIWINGNCLCPNNFQWNGYSCVPCTNGKTWDSLNRICTCPNKMIWNGFACISCQGGKVFDPNSKTCNCPSGYTWNGYICDVICPPDQFWNTTTNQCQCAASFIWNGINCIQCTNGRYYNSFTRQCECQSGFWNGYICSTICINGMNWNPNINACQCPRRTYILNGNCVPCGTMNGDSSRRECQCTGTTSYFNGYTCTTCDRNRNWNAISAICECPTNTKWNGTDCTSSLCNIGYQQIGKSCFCPLNTYESNGQCLTYSNCLSGTIWNNQLKRCDPILCDAGTFWNGQTCFSQNQNNDCPFGTYWNNFFCASYADTCPQGTQWNGDYCITVDKKCQAGTYWSGTVCLNIPSQCPPQLVWKDAQNRCVPSSNICPSGTYYNGFSCMPYSSCKNGQIWSSTLVQCICPQNSYWNGNTCITCKSGMLYGNSGCFCPLGTFLNGDKCSKIPTKDCSSVANSKLVGENCQCLPGFDKVDMSCICNGVVIGEQCNKCTVKPNSIWTGYTCQCKQEYVEVNGKCKLIKQTQNPNRQSTHKSQCAVGTYFEVYQQKCLLCSDGCLSCKNCYDCQQCRPQYNYFLPSKSCTEICGDGKRFSLQCDDGNNQDGDGCSSDCKIQSQYTCNGGSPNSKDSCTKHKPEMIDMILSGQTHLYGKIILNVMLNYLPTNLTLNADQCRQSCDKILLVKLIDGQKTFLSINSQYIKTTSYSFSIEIDFGRQPISTFVAEISINGNMKDKYFTGIDITKTVRAEVNPAYLALVVSNKKDTLA